eukprot:5786515-Amphidinium_carterae.2
MSPHNHKQKTSTRLHAHNNGSGTKLGSPWTYCVPDANMCETTHTCDTIGLANTNMSTLKVCFPQTQTVSTRLLD